VQNQAAEVALRAQRAAGEVPRQIPATPGARTDLTSSHDVTRLKSAALEHAGITLNERTRWESVADLAEERFEAYIAETQTAARELTTAGVLRLASEPPATPMTLPCAPENSRKTS